MFRTCFQFDLAAGAVLNQDCNIDEPTFRTAQGLSVTLSSYLGGSALILVGTVKSDGSLWAMQDHIRVAEANGTVGIFSPYFTWDYTTQLVRVSVTNLSAVADTFYMTIESGR